MDFWQLSWWHRWWYWFILQRPIKDSRFRWFDETIGQCPSIVHGGQSNACCCGSFLNRYFWGACTRNVLIRTFDFHSIILKFNEELRVHFAFRFFFVRSSNKLLHTYYFRSNYAVVRGPNVIVNTRFSYKRGSTVISMYETTISIKFVIRSLLNFVHIPNLLLLFIRCKMSMATKKLFCCQLQYAIIESPTQILTVNRIKYILEIFHLRYS